MRREGFSKLAAASIVVVAAGLGGCSSEQVGATVGGIVGSVAGAEIGSETGRAIATGIGGAMGAYFGAEIVRALTEEDVERMSAATAEALIAPEERARRAWSNEETGNGGEVTTEAPELAPGDGRRCRNFTQAVTLADGTSESATGRACQEADGSWSLVT